MKIWKIMPVLAVLASSLAFAGGVEAAVFTGTFSGANEAPANASTGTGNITVTVDETLQTMLVEISFSDLTGTVAAAHLHCCAPPGMNDVVAVTTPTLTGFPAGVTSGNYSMSFDLTAASTFSASFITNDGGGTVAGAAALFLASLADGLVYANIHTSLFPGGEIRANLSPVTASEVPVPAALWIFLLGAVAISGVSRSRVA